MTLIRPVLTVRLHAGFNANVFLAGLLGLFSPELLDPQEFLKEKFPRVEASLKFSSRRIHSITGVTVDFGTPTHEHTHRNLSAIASYYIDSALTENAKEKAFAVWRILANAEARVHGISLEAVHFHEVGRLSNILAVGLCAELITALNPSLFSVSAIPLGDGEIRCAHGLVPNPAPALFAMLDNIPVKEAGSESETITPTGLASLLGLGATFGPWPTMRIQKHATAYLPRKVFEHTANGALFALGTPFTDSAING